MVLQIYFPNKDIYLYNFVTIKDMVCVPIQGKILEMLPDDTFIFFIECPPPPTFLGYEREGVIL